MSSLHIAVSIQLYRVHMGKSMPPTHHVKPRYEYNFRIYIYNRIDAIAPTRIWTSLPKKQHVKSRYYNFRVHTYAAVSISL